VTVLPQLRAEVVAAVAAPRRRRRVPLTPVFALAAVAVTVAIVVLALPGEPPDAPTPVAGTPPASQLARFGVLRRAPTPADREALRTLYAQLAPADIPDLREDYVRAVGPDLILYSLPYANRLWDAVNGGVRSDPLCIYATTGGLGCWTSEQLAAGVSFTAGDRRIGLVPDGVASVTLRLEDGSDHSAPVRDNVYELEVPMPKGVAPDVRGVTWRKADGEFAGP
jgi:hypothetical protein